MAEKGMQGKRITKPPGKKRKPGRKSEDPSDRRARAAAVIKILAGEFPRARTALVHNNPFQLLIATILSAQCTDERVNIVTRELFKKYLDPADFAGANPEVLESEIRSTGFFRMKTKNVIACSKAIVERHASSVPGNMEELVRLPGVGRKTANVVLGQAFGIASGVVVDTHVQRLAGRLGFSAAENPEKIEEDLMSIFPKKEWIDIGTLLILHGRRTCKARKPGCIACPVVDLCPSGNEFLQ